MATFVLVPGFWLGGWCWQRIARQLRYLGLGDPERALMKSRAVAQPVGVIREPLRLTNPDRERLPKVAVLCTLSLAGVQEIIANGLDWVQQLAGPQWRCFELPTGHWPMFSRPDDVARLLDKLTAS